MKWCKLILQIIKNYFRKIFSMYYVLRVRFKANKEIEQCDIGFIAPPDCEMFVVIKGGKILHDHEGLHFTVEQANAACEKFQELERLKKQYGNN